MSEFSREECRFCDKWPDWEDTQLWSRVCPDCDQLREDLKVQHPHLNAGQLHTRLKKVLQTRGKLEDLQWMLAHDECDARVLARRLDYKAPAGLARLLERQGRTDLEARIVWRAPGVQGGRERQFA